MKALITGGSGFIGSHLTEALLGRGDEVIILDDLSTGRIEHLAHLDGNPRLKIVIGTILNERLVDKLAEEADVIFHLAAAVGVKLIVSKPFESLTTNIRGSEIVLEMAHRYRRKVLITSTSEIYGKNASGPLDEEQDRILGSPLKTRWSYSTAKSSSPVGEPTFRQSSKPLTWSSCLPIARDWGACCWKRWPAASPRSARGSAAFPA